MPKNTPQIRRHGPDPHGERTADMELSLEDTKCGKLRFRHTDFTDDRMESRENTPATVTKFFVSYTSGCSREFRFLLHVISTRQTLNKMYGCKFNIKVITDYLLTLLSLT
jgi:hypothetical protein